MSDEAMEIRERWAGTIHVDDGEGIAAIAITDDEAYDRLLARLPAERVQMKQPAPPNDDPLRARPAIDFAVHMLVVVTRGGSMAPIAIAQVARAEGGAIVPFAAAPPPPEARPWGVGRYAAALVPRVDGAIELRAPRAIGDEAEVDGAVGELVTLHGPLARTRIPTILGVDVDPGSADPDQPAVATGWLEREVVTPVELDETIAAHGQVAHRGPGTFHRLVAVDGEGLARADRRW
jgi:hypothetical protein